MTSRRQSDSSRVAGLVLASGMSTRFGAANKLLTEVEGEPVVRRSTLAYVDSGLKPVLVVVGYQADAVRKAVADLGVMLVDNREYQLGQSRALVHGVEVLPAFTEAAVIGVADQPWLQSSTIELLVETWQRTGAAIVAPLYSGRRGNPVLFSQCLFGELTRIEGDVGGRPVIQKHLDRVVWVAVPDARQAADVDEHEDLRG